MRYSYRWVIGVLILTGLGLGVWALATTGADAETAPKKEPAIVEHVEGTELSRVILSERAAERLDIQTAKISEEQISGAGQSVIPYAAVIYDANGEAWAYTNPEPLVYVRAKIEVD